MATTADAPRSGRPPRQARALLTLGIFLTLGVAFAQGGTLRVGTEQDADNLDPALAATGPSINIVQHAYDSLMMLDESLVPQPQLAESVDQPDELTYVFHLRRGVRFHNGRELTADDVLYTFERLQDPGTGSPYSFYFLNVTSITAPDPYTVEFRLSAPDATLLSNLARPNAGIVAREAVEENGDLRRAVVGTGPFKLVDWQPGSRLVMERHDDYFVEGQPVLDRIEFLPITDETARTNALRTGAVDMIYPVPSKDVETLRGLQGIEVVGGYDLNYIMVPINITREPFDDPNVRRAVAMALDREAIGLGAFDGYAKPLPGGPLVPPFWAGSDIAPYEKPDLAEARRLLAAAGYPNGFATSISIPAGYAVYQRSAEMFQADLSKIGINVEIDASEVGIWLDKIWTSGDYDTYLVRFWGIDFTDPDGALYRQFHSAGDFNMSGYANPRVDELLEAARVTSDVASRKALYDEVQAILAEEVPAFFLIAIDRYTAHSSAVTGFRHMIDGSGWFLRTTSLGGQ
jgi:peptide/nickel transport system substrate-binding protein